jgi:hypothetical protein
VEVWRAIFGKPSAALTLADVSGSSFSRTIKDQLDEERQRKNSLEGRGIGIVTSSGALATLLFGLVAFARGTNPQLHWEIGTLAKIALLISVALFAFAALMGLAANFPGAYKEASVKKLRERVQPEVWMKPDPIEAARYDAEVNVGTIDAARTINDRKAKVIRWGVAAEAGAAVAVALAVAAEIFGL